MPSGGRVFARCAAVLCLLVVGCSSESVVDGDGGSDGGNVLLDGGPRDARPRARCGDTQLDEGEECDDGNTFNGDGCTADCRLECGDGVVDPERELCDTAIADGEEGACPSDCDDGDPCTTDSLSGSGCSAECVYGAITAPADGDACCPDGASAATDSDCPGACGDGFVTGDEVCDTGIAAGTAGACPTDCDDLDSCTTDTLHMAGTCEALCTNVAITAPADGDQCCPAGATLADDSDCPIACGDGVLSAGETCDTAIAAGVAGACPTSCDDGNVCTADSVANAGTCSAVCASSPITEPAAGDGCCPPGATTATDPDCTGVCGDGIVQSGESCDTAIAAGMPGACPTSCNDGMACTADTLVNGGTCSASCTSTPITAPANGDGCCPPGATIGNDDDCPAACGDGVVTTSAGETCDTAIAAGSPGACPTSCNDGMVCTTDTLANAGTCRAQCMHTPITAPANGDGCCPTGATACNDNDCSVRCGDSCVSTGEECDDGNTTSGDGCSATCQNEAPMPTAFRFSDLDLMDPHVYVNVSGLGCTDATNIDINLFGRRIRGINPLLQTSIQTDGDGDDDLDLSIAQVFAPLVQTAGTSTPTYLVFPDCTAPMSSTMCTEPAGATRTTGTAVNQGGGATCLGILSGTVRPYSPAVVQATSTTTTTCFSASAGAVTFDLGGIPITLYDAHVAGRWSGVPATQITQGLIRGFLPEADAHYIYVPQGTTGMDTIDCQPLSTLLPGGNPPPFQAGDPQPPAPCPERAVGHDLPRNCASHSDIDTLPDGTRGWYFYLNFQASRVPYTEAP